LTARRIDYLREIAAEIVKEIGNGVKVLPVQLDISNPDDVRTLVARLPAEFKQVDVLVNNALVFARKERQRDDRDSLCLVRIYC
jgi:3-hydroxy acid dehydrogenase/malonic semialdehyde reductase